MSDNTKKHQPSIRGTVANCIDRLVLGVGKRDSRGDFRLHGGGG